MEPVAVHHRFRKLRVKLEDDRMFSRRLLANAAADDRLDVRRHRIRCKGAALDLRQVEKVAHHALEPAACSPDSLADVGDDVLL